jgi:hypothetical protein
VDQAKRVVPDRDEEQYVLKSTELMRMAHLQNRYFVSNMRLSFLSFNDRQSVEHNGINGPNILFDCMCRYEVIRDRGNTQ